MVPGDCPAGTKGSFELILYVYGCNALSFQKQKVLLKTSNVFFLQFFKRKCQKSFLLLFPLEA